MAGTDDHKIWQLPDTTGLKHEVIMMGGRSAFDSAIRLTGAKLVACLFTGRTFQGDWREHGDDYTTDLGEKLQSELKIAKEPKIPMLLDDCGGNSSGGQRETLCKDGNRSLLLLGRQGLRGPQCSGLLLGRKDLIEAALLNSSPREGAVCRPMKVGKEEVIGCVAALETWLKIDEKKLYEEWNARIDRIRKLVETVPQVKTSTYVPDDGNRYPTLKYRGISKRGVHNCRLRARIARGRSGDRGAWNGQSQPGDGGFARGIRYRLEKSAKRRTTLNWCP